ncbi:hypothetical protein Barb7_02139 [Bacteroidales bacterium Barb7]|nr:hypothetical protein Barb7_02139 [Bacteroidales bacterium Barb7]
MLFERSYRIGEYVFKRVLQGVTAVGIIDGCGGRHDQKRRDDTFLIANFETVGGYIGICPGSGKINADFQPFINLGINVYAGTQTPEVRI